MPLPAWRSEKFSVVTCGMSLPDCTAQAEKEGGSDVAARGYVWPAPCVLGRPAFASCIAENVCTFYSLTSDSELGTQSGGLRRVLIG